MTTQIKAKLRVCVSCEWIYKEKSKDFAGCPKCGFATYGARFVYGDMAYQYAKTQKPWKEKKLFKYETELDEEITQNTETTGNKFPYNLIKVG